MNLTSFEFLSGSKEEEGFLHFAVKTLPKNTIENLASVSPAKVSLIYRRQGNSFEKQVKIQNTDIGSSLIMNLPSNSRIHNQSVSFRYSEIYYLIRFNPQDNY